MLSLLLACAKAPEVQPLPAEALRAELVVEGRLKDRVSAEPADLVLFYGGEHKGSMETCGCPRRPRGSLARLASYIEASTAAGEAPALLLHGGYWLEDAMGLDGELREDVPIMNRWMIEGMEAAGVEVANLSFQDLPGVDPLERMPDWVVSANIQAAAGAPAPARYRILEAGGLRVGVTGITAPGMTFVETPDYSVGDPVAGGLAALEELAPQVDVLVLLSFQAPQAAKALAEAVPELDVVIDTNMHREFYQPFTVGDAVWVRSHYQTQRLGELRLRLDGEGRIAGALDRKIDLDPQIPDDPEIAALARRARKELEAVQEVIYGP